MGSAEPDGDARVQGALPVNEFDSNFRVLPPRVTAPSAGVVDPAQYLDILSYRQRPTWRLASEDAGPRALVTKQSVEVSR